ncbi:MAG: transglycosylase SLT domain-containing protein [Gemmatimonadaceae bacterium]|nr:transglycosylase SLT domain-containing protein [Gemmatimonadaceae bacterium]
MSEPEVENRREAEGDIFTNVRVRHPRQEQADWIKLLKGVAHAVGAAILLIAGTVWTLRLQHPKYVNPGGLLNLPAAVVTAPSEADAILMDTTAPPPTTAQAKEQVFKISRFLHSYTRDTVRANRIATAIVDQAAKRHLSPTLLVGILLTEDAKLDPQARSSVGARGLFQVMPFHAGKHDCGSSDLFNIEANVCYGASIIQQLSRRSPSMARALQRYNGCVHGTNTPNCYTYSGKVFKFAEQAATKMLSFRVGD